MRSEKDQAYWERNQLVAYLSRKFEAWIEKHPETDELWEKDWRNIIFISFPEGLFSWHIHDSELQYFDHLNFREGNSWDGSTTEQKYEKLRTRKAFVMEDILMKPKPVKQ